MHTRNTTLQWVKKTSVLIIYHTEYLFLHTNDKFLSSEKGFSCAQKSKILNGEVQELDRTTKFYRPQSTAAYEPSQLLIDASLFSCPFLSRCSVKPGHTAVKNLHCKFPHSIESFHGILQQVISNVMYYTTHDLVS